MDAEWVPVQAVVRPDSRVLLLRTSHARTVEKKRAACGAACARNAQRNEEHVYSLLSTARMYAENGKFSEAQISYSQALTRAKAIPFRELNKRLSTQAQLEFANFLYRDDVGQEQDRETAKKLWMEVDREMFTWVDWNNAESIVALAAAYTIGSESLTVDILHAHCLLLEALRIDPNCAEALEGLKGICMQDRCGLQFNPLHLLQVTNQLASVGAAQETQAGSRSEYTSDASADQDSAEAYSEMSADACSVATQANSDCADTAVSASAKPSSQAMPGGEASSPQADSFGVNCFDDANIIKMCDEWMRGGRTRLQSGDFKLASVSFRMALSLVRNISSTGYRAVKENLYINALVAYANLAYRDDAGEIQNCAHASKIWRKIDKILFRWAMPNQFPGWRKNTFVVAMK